MIRYVTVILDLSRSALRQDLSPSRAVVIKKVISNLLNSFHDQNPISSISVIVTMKEQAMLLSRFTEDKAVAI